MSSVKKVSPAVTINGKEYCINIGRDVVRVLGYPSYINILEHEKWQVMAITPGDESDMLAFKVPEGFPDENERKFRIYSQSLIKEILEDCNLDCGEAYNLKGEYKEVMNAVLFHLSAIEDDK